MGESTSQLELNVGDLLSRSWKTMTESLPITVGGMAVILLILGGLNYVSFGLASIVLGGPLMLGYCGAVLRVTRGEPNLPFGEVFSGFQRFLPAFLANLLMSVFIAVGTMLCVIPGLFVSMIYMLTYFYMADRQIDFWPAMEASRQTVMANLGPWIILFLVLIAINLAGSLACGIGIFVSAPLTFVILAEAYKKAG